MGEWEREALRQEPLGEGGILIYGSLKSMTSTDGCLVLGRFGGQLDILDESLAEFNLALR